MAKAGAKTKSLFKKAHKHNWDNGRSALTKILDDKDCDKATALLIFWRGSPDYYYNHKDPGKFQPYEKEAFKFLQRIEAAVLAGKYPSVISWEPEKELVPKRLGKIPAKLAEPVSGVVGYKEILYPNDNPFADQVFALCSNCKSVDETATPGMYKTRSGVSGRLALVEAQQPPEALPGIRSVRIG